MHTTINALIDFTRANVKGTTAITVTLASSLDDKGKMLKTNNPFHGKGLHKISTLNGMIGYSYTNAINRLASKEGKEERVAKPHPWGDMDSQRLFRIHRTTGEHYLSMKVQSESFIILHPDGTELPKEVIVPYLPPESKSSTQADLDGEVIAKDFKLTNIQKITILSHTFHLQKEPVLA